jgi:UDP-4-amino-4,6-dideoxy-N-acetyl-beta-L-altrosamine transaminase
MIPYGRQAISDNDIQAVVDVLRSDFLTQGPTVPAFEDAVARFCGVKHAVAVNSATSALHLACLALGIGPGDLLWTSPITFSASSNCALYCGADVDFVDIDRRSYNLSVDRLAEKLATAEASGRLPKVLVAVHLCGEPCDMAGIRALSERYGFNVIEDASHAIGGKYQDETIGSCRYSDITVFSFHPVKIITTGEGGMLTTHDARLARRMQLFRSHGITRDPSEMTHAPDGPWYYEQIELGYNYRLTDLHAALGLSQMQRLTEFVATRHEMARRYDRSLAALPLTTPWRDPSNYSGMHLYVIRLDLSRIRRSRLEVFNSMRASGIGVNLHYIPVYRHPYYQRMGFEPQGWPQAEAYYSEAISLPIYIGLTQSEQDRVVAALTEAVAA